MDKISKILLALIAAGLWTNVIMSAARAQGNPFSALDPMASLAADMNQLVNGTCANQALCSQIMRH